MNTCTNITATSWLTMRVAKAACYVRYNRGRAFGSGLSQAGIGHKEGNLDRPDV